MSSPAWLHPAYLGSTLELLLQLLLGTPEVPRHGSTIDQGRFDGRYLHMINRLQLQMPGARSGYMRI